MSDAIAIGVALVAGAISAVTGFGIGSLLTPVLAWQVDTRVAVAAVSIPHLAGTALRFWLLKGRAEPKVVWNFGITSALGGLTGALLQGSASNRWLTALFGVLLVGAGVMEWTGLTRRLRFHGAGAWIAGALSGVLGGLVGNQGGLRSAALLGFNLSKESFVATATAVALFVDGARMPIYFVTQQQAISTLWSWIAVATVGVIIGTMLGSRVLSAMPESWFRGVLAVILAALGGTMIARAF
jgi:uncharacterized membrane protein YfcA